MANVSESEQQERKKNEFKIYNEDVVKLKRIITPMLNQNELNHDMLGVVQRIGGDDEDSSDEEDEDEELKENWARILWENGEETDVSFERLEVIDRALLHGDIVGRVNEPFGQSGTVVDVDLTCDLSPNNPTNSTRGRKISKIDSTHLAHISPYKRGLFAIYEDWLCRIEDVTYDIIVIFKDKAKALIKHADEDKLLDDEQVFDDDVPFYPSQVIQFSDNTRRRLLRQAQWISGAYNSDKHKRGTVLRVIPTNVDLEFLASRTMSQTPPDEIDISKINVFQHYFHTNWATSDRALVRPESQQEVLRLDTTRLSQDMIALSRTVIIAQTHTNVKIQWQDGTFENVPAMELAPLAHLGDYDFWPEDFVTYRNKDEEEETPKKNRRTVGIIKSVNAKERIAIVKWLKEVDDEEEYEEELPVYELKNHEDYEYRLGDVVLRMTALDMGNSTNVDWAGEIIEMKSGALVVCWVSGAISTVKYDEVVAADKVATGDDEQYSEYSEEDDDPNSISNQIEDAYELMDRINENGQVQDDDDQSWETVSGADGEEAEEVEDVESEDEEEENGEPFAPTNDIQVPLQQYIHRLEEIETRQQEEKQNKFKYDRNVLEDYIADDDDEEEPKQVVVPAPQPVVVVEQPVVVEQTVVEPTEDNMDTTLHIPRFQTVEDTSDHKYNDRPANTTAQLARTVRKEWTLLQRNLPDNVFVRAYESRMDLMRAIIIGPRQTPYYNSVFIFDIYLPPDYPNNAPKVHFWSFGAKVNPNLYADGKICLSLLGTWAGKNDEENWIPDKSNILQLIVSIMGLVLVSEPYYNEANYDKQIGTTEGHHNSILYNENALLLSAWHIIKTLRNTPLHCKEIVRQHFEQFGQEIIRRLESYLSGEYKPIQERFDDNGLMQMPPSVGFLKSLEKALPKLKEILKK
jgi:ubiquitin-conjugating enzyme E2 O